MRISFRILRMLFVVLIVNQIILLDSAKGQSPDGISQARGFVIIINDLVKVDEKGLLAIHETKRDAELNIQAKVSGNIRVGEDGFWRFKKGQTTVKFQKSVLYLRFDKTVPLTIEVLFDLLDEKEETKDLPILIKAENDEIGRRFRVRINDGVRAGVLLPLTTDPGSP